MKRGESESNGKCVTATKNIGIEDKRDIQIGNEIVATIGTTTIMVQK